MENGISQVKVERLSLTYFILSATENINTKYRSLKVMSKIENWELAKLQHHVDTLPVRLHIVSDDPDGLKGINQEKIAKEQYEAAVAFGEELKTKQIVKLFTYNEIVCVLYLRGLYCCVK